MNKKKGRIDRLTFVLGGVLVPRVSQSAMRVLSIKNELLEPEIQLALHRLEAKLYSGLIDPEGYCMQVIQVTGRMLKPSELRQGIQGMIVVDADILLLIDYLSKDYLLTLICDYPREWLLPVLSDCGLANYFSFDQIVFSEDFQTASPGKVLILGLTDASILQPGKTLLVDSDPTRTHKAVQMGIDGTIYVSASRLRRDLKLWGIIHNNP